MQFRTLQEVLIEGIGYHQTAQDTPSLMKQERAELYRKAEYCYNHVLENQPEAPQTLANLGALYAELGKTGIALALLYRAQELDPCWDNLNAIGAAYRRAQNVPKAREYMLKAYEINPESPVILSNLAGTYINEGNPEEAVKWSKLALEREPNNPNFALNYGLALLETGNFKEGWQWYDRGRENTTWTARDYGPDVKRWNGEPNKIVVVYGEQGVGDEILFASCLPDLIKMSEAVVIDCHPRLVDVMARSFPDCIVQGTRKEEYIRWNPKDYGITHKVPIGSLPRFFRNERKDFPSISNYIQPDPEQVKAYKKPGLRVGLSWAGGTKATHVGLRSIDPRDLGPILNVPGIDWVSLQYTNNADLEVEKMRQEFGCRIEHDNEMNADLDKLFGCIAGLDLIVTVCTSVVHFAGAMNKKALVMTPIKSAWRYAVRPMPWYPQHELILQKTEGDWNDVLHAIADRLEAMTAARAA
jgi:hypothetical protein